MLISSRIFFQANKKTRNRAYDILVQIGHACMDDNKGGKIEYLYHLFNMVLKIVSKSYFLVISHVNNINGLSYQLILRPTRININVSGSWRSWW